MLWAESQSSPLFFSANKSFFKVFLFTICSTPGLLKNTNCCLIYRE